MIMPSVVRSLHQFAGVGVTSILPVPTVFNDDEHSNDMDDILLSFYVGTKRGKLKKVTLKKNPEKKKVRDDDDVHVQCIKDEDDDDGCNKGKTTPYPIFSMMSLHVNHNHHHVVSGSGNRYITIWEELEDNRQQEDDGIGVSPTSWRIKAKLGPHTGWVKDLASSHFPTYLAKGRDVIDKGEEEEKFIFSIGCNCIEVWKTTIHGETYDHVYKLMIESSVEMGSTLSNDILCLATTPPAPYYYYNNNNNTSQKKKKSEQQEEQKQQQQNHYYLFAGGVDGRIHRWTICNNSFSNAQVVNARGHDGRVNALLVCDTLQAVVSIGNDGVVKCWRLDDRNVPFMDRRRVWSINLNDEHNVVVQEADTIIKLTCSCILLEKQDLAIIGIGTACGKVLLAELIFNDKSTSGGSSDDDVMSITLLDERIVVASSSSTKGVGGCTIHSIASPNNHIIIGHSEGITIWKPMLCSKNPSPTKK